MGNVHSKQGVMKAEMAVCSQQDALEKLELQGCSLLEEASPQGIGAVIGLLFVVWKSGAHFTPRTKVINM